MAGHGSLAIRKRAEEIEGQTPLWVVRYLRSHGQAEGDDGGDHAALGMLNATPECGIFAQPQVRNRAIETAGQAEDAAGAIDRNEPVAGCGAVEVSAAAIDLCVPVRNSGSRELPRIGLRS